MAEKLDKSTMGTLYTALVLFYVVIIILGLEILGDFFNGKSTAMLTASFREASTYHLWPHTGTDNYAYIFSWPIVSYFLSYSPIFRWLAYNIMSYAHLGNVVGHVIGRTFVIDQIIDNELNSNEYDYKQFVILGAGYDTRSLRFKSLLTQNDIAIYEVDLKSTQRQKLKKFKKFSNLVGQKQSGNLNYVSIDFNKDSLLDKLKSYGYDETLQTLFLFEGVSYYLDQQSVSNTLTFVAEHSGINSLIVWDLFHSCFLDLYGNVENKGKSISEYKQFERYCWKNKMNSKLLSVYGHFGKFLFDYILNEPFYFGLYWDVKEPFDEPNNELYSFHAKNCLKFEKFYGTDKTQTYLTYNISKDGDPLIQRKLLDIVTPGMATVAGRKTQQINTCQP